jgi:(p)ppGpp synthase/HD superfamily hydrolase
MAVTAHGDAVDKAGEPYYLHVLSVMLDPSLTTEDERIVAVLHDTKEDTDLSDYAISSRFGKEILEGVESVSRKFTHKTTGQALYHEPPPEFMSEWEKETYTNFCLRSAQHPIGRKVKKADIRHNLSPRRMNQLPEDMRGISKRYIKGLTLLGVSEEEIALFVNGK